MKHAFSITNEDYQNSGKNYTSIADCPATIALKRQFGINGTIFRQDVVPREAWGQSKIHFPAIGRLNKEWTNEEFNELKEGKEFHTEIELFNT